jgi:hypothetical protein
VSRSVVTNTRVARFILVQYIITGKKYQITVKYAEFHNVKPNEHYNRPNDRKISTFSNERPSKFTHLKYAIKIIDHQGPMV